MRPWAGTPGNLPLGKNENILTMLIIVCTIAEKVVAGNRPVIGPEIPAKLSELIQLCWNHDRTRRPTFAQIVTGRMLEKSKMP